MKKILITTPEQFGYLTDTYKYCQHLYEDFDIDYICLEHGNEKIIMNNINVIYLRNFRNIFLRYLYFNIFIILQVYKKNYDILFCVYNPLVFIQKIMLPHKKIILDIRTGSVAYDNNSRTKANNRILFNSKFFNNISIISSSLADYLKLNKNKYTILPLGADQKVYKENIDINQLSLLYVGVLSGRQILDTVIGFKKFTEEYGKKIKCEYKIVGYFKEGCQEEVDFLNEIKGCKNIEYLGSVYHDELNKFYNHCNIGISYIPITEYYDHQPPTKTFEYLQNGLITVATKTSENRKYISKKNGVLCDDNSNSFYKSLEKLYMNLDKYSIRDIKSSVEEYTWEKIAKSRLKNYINGLLKGK